MFKLSSALPKGNDIGEDWLGGNISSAQLESTLMQGLGLLQKYGVLITLTCLIMFAIFRKISNIRKNKKFARFWLMSSWGMVFLTVVFIVLPYVVLYFY